MFSALLITGGYNTHDSTEVFHPATSTSCQLPRMVLDRYGHTQDNLLLCGGDGDSEAATTCEQFSPATGTWARPSHTLQDERASHVSWHTADGGIHLWNYI